MSKHTIGPWHWHSDNGLWSEANGAIITASDDGASYGMQSGVIEHHFDNETKEANKALIAAAPDLLEALVLCRQHMYDFASNTPDGAFDRLCYAINKATGE